VEEDATNRMATRNCLLDVPGWNCSEPLLWHPENTFIYALQVLRFFVVWVLAVDNDSIQEFAVPALRAVLAG
jgi:hypothetical protein